MSCGIEIAGRFARAALAPGEGVACAVFRRSFYLQCAGGRYACIGDRTLGRGPLNALVAHLHLPALGDNVQIRVDEAATWQPELARLEGKLDLSALEYAAAGRIAQEGLGCLIVGGQNPLASHAQPALDALHGWLAGNELGEGARELIGLGPGLTPSGDDYLGGILVALHSFGNAARAERLWRWLEPQLAARTSAISAAHLEAAAAGEAHEALHLCVYQLISKKTGWHDALAQLDAVGHCSGWDALAGVVAVARAA